MAGPVSFEVSQKDIDRIQAKLKKASGLPLQKRMQKAVLAAGDILVPRVRAETPRKTGHLRRYTKSRLARKRVGSALYPSMAVLVGPTSPHRHLVIRGTKPHAVYSQAGKQFAAFPNGQVRRFPFSHPGSRPNPYVDRAARGFERKAAELVRKEWAAALR